MAEILLLPEQQFTSVYVEGTGWCWDIPATFDLVPGQSYRIVFDGAEWPCIAVDISAMIPNTVAIGNGAAFGLPGNGEPFVVMDYIGGDEISILCLTDSAIQNTHTISIYGEESGEPEQPKILLRDHTGTAVGYEMPQRLRLDTSDGGTTEFIHEDLVAEPVEKEVELDFSGGDMTVEPEDGTLFSKVAILKPEHLVPENIAEGVNIAGIVGALAAGGSTKVAYGEFTGNGASVTLEHGLGVTPDIFFVRSKSSKSGITFLSRLVGMSTAFKTKCEWAQPQMLVCHNNGAVDARGITLGIDTDNVACPASNANSDSIVVGASAYPLYNGFTYAWTAIGGLT